MNKIQSIIQSFEPVSLQDIDSVKLMNRMDTKFLFSIDKLPGILETLISDYFILEVNGVRQSEYRTMYYDSEDFYCYYIHQRGRANRLKCRTRQYVENDKFFFEVKKKDNHKKTTKTRISLKEKSFKLSSQKRDFLDQNVNFDEKEFSDKLMVNYKRISLINKNFTERLTIDTNLSFKNDDDFAEYPKLVILELKQDKSSVSKLRQVLQHNNIYQSTISKYCLGIASLYPVKTNNINEKIRLINKLCYENR